MGKLTFRIAAVVNWVVALPGIVAPDEMARFIGVAPSNYPFLVRIWAGMVFMFGCMFWEISRDLFQRRHLIKYAWIEKLLSRRSP